VAPLFGGAVTPLAVAVFFEEAVGVLALAGVADAAVLAGPAAFLDVAGAALAGVADLADAADLAGAAALAVAEAFLDAAGSDFF